MPSLERKVRRSSKYRSPQSASRLKKRLQISAYLKTLSRLVPPGPAGPPVTQLEVIHQVIAYIGSLERQVERQSTASLQRDLSCQIVPGVAGRSPLQVVSNQPLQFPDRHAAPATMFPPGAPPAAEESCHPSIYQHNTTSCQQNRPNP